ncbi:MAG TPA: alpha/beta hydrolase [Pseudonocardiaceae bacterium]|nr:alpha/beta hydrolase [Pseudonocardiaceae bacterium]
MRIRRWGVSIVSALCLVFGLCFAPVAAAAGPVVPRLDWQACGDGFFCATAIVPLDYADPSGATIRLAMIKHPATDPAHRIGSLFFNPGGPGGSGVAALPLIYHKFPAALRADFDLVSFDPRGIASSTDLQCFPSTTAEQQFLARLPVAFPVGKAQERLWENTFSGFDRTCAANAGPLLAHDSTADVARDMDLLRQAVGDPTMNYLGVSYGSYLGATYANLFPAKVRAIALDGDVDPVEWATGETGNQHWLSTFLRLGSDEASARTLGAFLVLCGQAPVTSCAFSAGNPAATNAKFTALLHRLATHPVTADGQQITMPLVVAVTVADLYETQPIAGLANGWPGLATLLQNLWNLSNGTTTAAPDRSALLARPDLGVVPTATPSYAGREAQLGVICSDSPNPRLPQSYGVQSAFARLRSGWPGAQWTWIAEACAQWPTMGTQRYTGPWNVPTAQPVLVIGNTGDPATPYQGAVAMARDLAHARFLTVRGYGHTALLNTSTCAANAESAYFRTGALPPAGTVCDEDRPPFP